MEMWTVWLENEVRVEFGHVLGNGRFLRGRQTPLGPAEGRTDAGSRCPGGGVTPAQRPPLGHAVPSGPWHRLFPIYSSPLHSSSGICWYFVCSQSCCPTVPGAQWALCKSWLHK